MNHLEIIKNVEAQGKYCNVDVSHDGFVTGILIDQNYRYRKDINAGGRRLIGDVRDMFFNETLCW